MRLRNRETLVFVHPRSRFCGENVSRSHSSYISPVNDGCGLVEAVANITETGSEAITQSAGQLQSIVPIVFAAAVADVARQENVFTQFV